MTSRNRGGATLPANTTRAMKAKIIYDLEASVRRERKRIAERNCKRWVLYYDIITGEYCSRPNITRAQVNATRLPSNANGTPTKHIAL